MKKSRYSDSQILNILKQAEAGVPVSAFFTHYQNGMVPAFFYFLTYFEILKDNHHSTARHMI